MTTGKTQPLQRFPRTQVGDQVIMRPNPAGPQDDEVLALRFDNSGGEPVAAIVNAATHPTTLGVDMYVISADYPGRMQRYLETVWHPGCTVAFLQGACGDVRPAIVDHAGHFAEGTEQDIEMLGKRLGKSVQKIFDNSQEISVPRFCSGLHRLVFPYRHLPTVQEGGYEVEVAYKLYGHPAAFHEDIEEILVREVGLLLNELKSV